MIISNSAQLNAAFSAALGVAVNGTTEKLLEELKKIIDNTVYSYGASWGGRTGQFKESWEKTSALVSSFIAESEIFQNFGTMVVNNADWQHGDPWSSLAPNALNNIINSGLSESHFGFPAIEARAFWDEFIMYVNSNIDGIFMEECAKTGLNLSGGISGSFS